MQKLPMMSRVFLGCGLIGFAGCGNASLMRESESSVPAGSIGVAVLNESCDPDRRLVVEIATGGAMLMRDITPAGLYAGTFLPGLNVEGFGLSASQRTAVVNRIGQLADRILAPFGIAVRIVDQDMTASVPDDPFSADTPTIESQEPSTARPLPVSASSSEEVIARIIVTHVAGAPEHCGCQGYTSALGLQRDGPAEGVVFSNAYLENGLAAALNRYPEDQRIEFLATAMTNSILHETGHALGLVHLDVAGQPTLLMARGGSGASRISLRALTTLQSFSTEARPTTSDSAGVRDMQCDTCVIEDALTARRHCAL